MYDTYSRYIYEWLINNNIAGKLDTVISSIESAADYILFFGLVYVAFKFLNKRWLLT